MKYALWIAQALLAVLFLFAGGFKLVSPDDTLTAFLPLPVAFDRFVGVAEVLGALGLLLPGLLRVRYAAKLTALAAAELVHVMVGATVISLATMDATAAILPVVVGLLAASVAYARWTPRSAAPRLVLHPAG